MSAGKLGPIAVLLSASNVPRLHPFSDLVREHLREMDVQPSGIEESGEQFVRWHLVTPHGLSFFAVMHREGSGVSFKVEVAISGMKDHPRRSEILDWMAERNGRLNIPVRLSMLDNGALGVQVTGECRYFTPLGFMECLDAIVTFSERQLRELSERFGLGPFVPKVRF